MPDFTPGPRMVTDPFDGENPSAHISRVGRWTYRVRVEHHITTWGADNGYGWHVIGLKRAKRKGRRVLAQYERLLARKNEGWYVDTTGMISNG